MTLQELEQVKQRIISERCMDEDKKSPRVTVGMGTCGIKAGAGMVLNQLQNEPALSLKAIVTHVGCLGLCTYEPVVQVSVPGQPPVTYCHVTPQKATRIAVEHVIGGKPVSEWVL